MARWAVRVTGTVQGVGFRPFVHGLAEDLGLTVVAAGKGKGTFQCTTISRARELRAVCQPRTRVSRSGFRKIHPKRIRVAQGWELPSMK